MIELPEDPAPNGVSPSLLDFGIIQRPATGGEVTRVDRKGSRYRLMVTYPLMDWDTARVFVSRLIRAKNEGIRIPYPLLVAQGAPGSPVVDGAGQTGTTLLIRGLTPGYAVKEGYWLSIVDENGRHYLHNAGSAVVADGSGDAELLLSEALRWPFADGATINLAKPMVEGFVGGEEWQWVIQLDKMIALQFPLEEAA